MLKRILTYIMVLMVVVKPVISMADAHQAHHYGVDHFSMDEIHHHSDGYSGESNDLSLYVENASEEHEDCELCYHCHTCLAILASIERVHFAHNISPIFFYAESTIPATIETFLRPPIV